MLASSGVDIVGIDVSLLMLRRAACGWPNRSETRPRIACGEFGRLPFRSSSFSTVIMPMRTLGHILDLQGRRAVFAEVYRVLQLDGRFVLDHYNLDEAWAKEHNGVPQLMHAGPADDDRSSALLIWDRYDYDFEARTLHCTVRIEEVGPSPMRISASSVEFDFRWFSASEIADLASWANLAVESCWGDFQRGPFTEKAEDMIFVLRK
jgi:SAM-dependent methyltransferase